LGKTIEASLEDGARREVDEGVPQAGSISPLLANVYLHCARDFSNSWQGRREHEISELAANPLSPMDSPLER
jgi:hypothetical protein